MVDRQTDTQTETTFIQNNSHFCESRGYRAKEWMMFKNISIYNRLCQIFCIFWKSSWIPPSHTYKHTHRYIYIYVCVSVSMYVCMYVCMYIIFIQYVCISGIPIVCIYSCLSNPSDCRCNDSIDVWFNITKKVKATLVSNQFLFQSIIARVTSNKAVISIFFFPGHAGLPHYFRLAPNNKIISYDEKMPAMSIWKES